MILSMTGYGRATGTFRERTISVEVRSLNSKVTDIKLRFPPEYREKELELRKIISDHADRGKIDYTLETLNSNGAANISLNEPLFRGYHAALTKLADELRLDTADLLPAILRIQNVVSSGLTEVDEAEWEVISRVTQSALDALRQFRIEEGKVIDAELRLRVSNIVGLLAEVTPYEEARFERMRERIRGNMEEVFGKENLDANRFEQEVLYYLEKMDMSEEKVRLAQHCKYFLDQMSNKQQAPGRSLGFMTQELGREINTLGAKAYDADIQRLVVQMKDELEKIKEQIANVL
jgi:uncharacterized protein (TIGR00255 family)